jgi:hypothetical protein
MAASTYMKRFGLDGFVDDATLTEAPDAIAAELGRESLTVSDRGLRHGLLVGRFPHPR